MTLCRELIRQTIRIAFSRSKDNRLIDFGVRQQVTEHFAFVRYVIGKHHALLNVFVFVFSCRHADTFR